MRRKEEHSHGNGNTFDITDRLMNFCTVLVHSINGGLGEVNVVASMIFGGISGSSVADTSALGSIEIPAMEDAGYPSGTAAGITVASSTMGMIIPPSTPMIVYSMISGLAIGLVTSPVGMCLNACNKINGMPIIEIFRHALPYITCNIIVLIAIAVFEPLTTWLPLMLGYSLN